MSTNFVNGATRFISSRKISLRVYLWTGSKPNLDCVMADIFSDRQRARKSWQPRDFADLP